MRKDLRPWRIVWTEDQTGSNTRRETGVSRCKDLTGSKTGVLRCKDLTGSATGALRTKDLAGSMTGVLRWKDLAGSTTFRTIQAGSLYECACFL